LISCGFADVGAGQSYPAKGTSCEGVVKQGKFVKRNSFLLLYISRGDCIVTIEGRKIQNLESGQCLLLEPNVKHQYEPLQEQRWTEYWTSHK
jgi:hypothetical protein